MSMKTNGGPAFPPFHDPKSHDSGMTLRDYFAAQVLAGMDADFSPSGLSWFEQHGAAGIYRIADAMLAAREVQL